MRAAGPGGCWQLCRRDVLISHANEPHELRPDPPSPLGATRKLQELQRREAGEGSLRQVKHGGTKDRASNWRQKEQAEHSPRAHRETQLTLPS